MKRGTIILLVVVGVILLVVAGIASTYNGMVGVQENLNNKWADVETQYQRRVDLIPAMVKTITAVAEKEKAAYADIAALRSGVAQAQKLLSDPNATQEDKVQAYTKLDQVRGGINIMVENYPNLKFPENFSKFQDELSGTENRVSNARQDYNAAVNVYNTRIRTFPRNIFAGMLGFKVKEGFRSDAGADKMPELNFE